MEEKKRNELTDEQLDKVAGRSEDSYRCNDYCPNCRKRLDIDVPAQGSWEEPCPKCGVTLGFKDGKIKYYIDQKGKRQPIIF